MNRSQKATSTLSAEARAIARRTEEHVVMLRMVAVLEAVKGLLAIIAASGLLILTPDDVQDVVARLVDHLHLDPAAHFPSLMLNVAGNTTSHYLRLVALGAFVYSGFRIAESIGLWRDRAWAEWLGVVTGLIYVPFEVGAFARHPGPEPLVAFLLNLAIVLYLGNRLRRRGKMRALADKMHLHRTH